MGFYDRLSGDVAPRTGAHILVRTSPTDGQQHKTVVEITGGLLGKEYGLVVKYFDRMRRSRNVFFYDSLDTGGQAQARKSLGTAEKLLEAVKAKIAERNPQFGLG